MKHKGVFYKKQKTTFKTGPLDIIVMSIVIFVFLYSFFILSFKPLIIDGEIIHSEEYWHMTGNTDRIPVINQFAIIGPLIIWYEALLLMLEGKKRGRYIEWNFYYQMLKYMIHLKIEEGRQQTKEYFEMRREPPSN